MLSRALVLFVLWLSSTFTAECCTIPVFRYALDRWEADPFHLVLPASASQDQALNDLLRPLRANGKANLSIETSKDPTLAQAELRLSTLDQETVWSGKLDQGSLSALLDSPARKTLAGKILAGESIVWVMADHGTPEDEAHAQRIEKRLRFLEQVAALPIQDPNDPDSQLGPGPPLMLKFTVLRLRADDPAEQMLMKMLTGPGNEIDSSKTGFAAAVFGRGRVLGAWPLNVLDDTTIEDACMFLVGRCSCRVKNQNPGWDILMNVDWPAALIKAGSTEPETTEAAPIQKQPEAVTTTASPATSASAQASAAPLWPWAAAGGALVLGAFAVALLRRGASKS